MNRTAVEEIKARIPIEDLIGSYVKMEKAGKSFKAKCPFHNEKTPSFFISPDRGGYYCFGCGAKGDIFSFVEQFEGLDFRGALKILAERAGVKLTYDEKADGERDRLLLVMEEAAMYFEDQLLGAGSGSTAGQSAEASAYVKSRGITEATRTAFRIGWAPDGWRNLHSHLKKKGFSDSIMEKAGLVKPKEMESQATSHSSNHSDHASSCYDRFRGRVMFPITDSSGRIIAFSGRILKDDGKSAKYLNSPDTPLYDKSLVLYGLDKAKSEIRRMGYSILVEGQMDMVLSHQAGVKNAVAASGTALTDESFGTGGAVSNLGLVRRLSPNLIVCFDSDTAGRKAALRAASIALTMGMDVKIAALPEGKDPADMVREDPESWKNAIRQAKQVVEFELDNVLSMGLDPRKLAKVLQERVYPLLLNVPSRSDREYFVKLIRDRAQMSREDVIWEDLRVLSERLEKENKSAVVPQTGSQISASSKLGGLPAAVRTSSEINSRIDLVEKRLFGLLRLMESAQSPHVAGYREQVRVIADSSYEERVRRIEPLLADAAFEAEAFFGEDADRWEIHAKELITNFEEDLVNEDLSKAMNELRSAERAGHADRVAELAKRCHTLSIRKAELGKNRVK